MSRDNNRIPAAKCLTLKDTFPAAVPLAADIAKRCSGCKRCMRRCDFLAGSGEPGKLAERLLRGDASVSVYDCTLCGLCSEICPESLQIKMMFLELRRGMAACGAADLRPYKRLLAYERRGRSKRFRYSHIPQGSETVFFPGCNLQGTRPRQTLWLYQKIQEHLPDIGIVLDCCLKSSHDLGRQRYFTENFSETINALKTRGVQKILVGCPSCYWVFQEYGGSLDVESVYEVLAENSAIEKSASATFQVHDACSSRNEHRLQQSIRALARAAGHRIKESKYCGAQALCCGGGAGVFCRSPELAEGWAGRRSKEAQGLPVLTYCGGCAEFLGSKVKTFHIIDLLHDPERALSGDADVSCSPKTYLNRLRLIQRLKKIKSKPLRLYRRNFFLSVGALSTTTIFLAVILGVLKIF